MKTITKAILLVGILVSSVYCQSRKITIPEKTIETTFPILKTSFPYYNQAAVDSIFADCYSNSSARNCHRAVEYLSIVGEYKAANILWDKINRFSLVLPTDSTLEVADWNLETALPYILKQAQHHQVVMINEAHHRPEGRIFSRQLIHELRQQGFSYLGVEGLKESGETFMQRKIPTDNSGFYLHEPHYANLLRQAVLDGYQVFDYDNTPGGGKQREINQAESIYKIIQKDPSAKIIIHAGYGHIREDQKILGGLMAYRFKEMSGINPLTINQTRYISKSTKAAENPLYQQLKIENAPAILMARDDGKPYTDEYTDLLIFHPKPETMFSMKEYFHRVSIEIEDYKSSDNLLYVYLARELVEKEPIPVLITPLEKKHEGKVTLFLPFKEEYVIYFKQGEELKPYQKIKCNDSDSFK